jgi:hypothetical protein
VDKATTTDVFPREIRRTYSQIADPYPPSREEVAFKDINNRWAVVTLATAASVTNQSTRCRQDGYWSVPTTV